ncbi:hypothetical protein THAPSDRAFT_22414 [Thalassiosira pseudonana CCMP1335]|uniref:HSF-type DNA-binding domain-containing protein n=1 Tax=Thalassiosira pseudonana TaxID=35128 RepID=B8C083_THAPS|nr:hypothetical protein THAPSDRAFT_22414 [Thalassiosira pseudonana CCMP1335]EED93475.1 hypothetical protein THAPSDRAFT_22414 [Thalassiosira pseudonana CCMP1335]
MSLQDRSPEEREAASIVVGLSVPALSSMKNSTKRSREEDDDNDDTSELQSNTIFPASKKTAIDGVEELDATGLVFAPPVLKPAPYFYYSDHSLEEDDDPLTPVTAAGRVPTFPAKMHAILSNPKLHHIVAWAPHGRSWRILKPRQFECYVLPKYFEHSKFSSFVRQANGWGFRRFSQGYDRNAYYHEYFLRSMPHLCKKMRRPKVAEKKALGPDMEPDLQAISAEFPVANKPVSREILIVQRTIEEGPRARMPVHWATCSSPPRAVPRAVNSASSAVSSESNVDTKPAALSLANVASLGGDIAGGNNGPMMNYLQSLQQQCGARGMLGGNGMPLAGMGNAQVPSAANCGNPGGMTDAQFAAGFMAATQYHNDHIRNMFGSAFIRGMPLQDSSGGVVTTNNAAAASSSAAAGTSAAAGANYLHLLNRPNPSITASTADQVPTRNNQATSNGLSMEQLQAYQAASFQFTRGGGGL